MPETQERCHHGLGRRTTRALEVLQKFDRQKARGRHVGPGADAPPERTLVELLSGLHGDVALRRGRDGRGALDARRRGHLIHVCALYRMAVVSVVCQRFLTGAASAEGEGADVVALGTAVMAAESPEGLMRPETTSRAAAADTFLRPRRSMTR